MKILLKPEHQQFIQAQISSGKFTDADEVIDVAFRLLDNLGSESSQWIEEVRAQVDVATAELERGEGLDGETVVNQILERFRQAREEHK
ncbi:ribbon-helix-helix domain-containing protein [Aliterella atlantica]|uniref:CopG family transcriptional regulator n=1 Tax=Aliterella atlantica CENA595 TaxID=1618023 RepID=A0A0D8ZSR3_9CYAN|nr:type II toxin-antitoxin system ParD family antitoxin [Aliterella atlantica]KJH71544.1 CopG family transcriptional regulator [Aliterella atlantica CENA595]